MRKEETGRTRGRYEANRTRESPRGGNARSSAGTGAPALSREAEAVRAWLKRVRFKKTVFGGVDEADVWKKIGELNTLYEKALAAERTRYDALLAERDRPAPAGNTKTAEREKSGEDLLLSQDWTAWLKEAGDVPYG